MYFEELAGDYLVLKFHKLNPIFKKRIFIQALKKNMESMTVCGCLQELNNKIQSF